jgi:cyanate permease
VERPSSDRPAAARSRDVAPLVLLVLGSLAYLSLTFVWFTLPAYLSTIIADLGLTSTQAGVLAGAVPLTYVPLSLVSGLVIDHIGSRRTIALSLAIFGSAQALRSTAAGFPALLVLTLLLGVGGTGATFGLPKLVAELFPAEHTGSVSSVYVVGSYLGTAGAFAVGRPLLGPALGGWRQLFLASGTVAVAFAVVWSLVSWLLRDRFEGPGTNGSEPRGFTLDGARTDVARVAGSREMRLLVVVGTTYLLLVHGLQGWLATIFEIRGLPAARAARVTSLLILSQVVGTVTVPPLADRYDRRRLAIVGAGGACVVGLVVLLAAGSVLAAAVPGVVAVGVGLGGLAPLIRTLPVEFEDVGEELTATAVGLVFAVGEMGGFLGPFLVGALRDATGSFAPGLALLAAGGCCTVLAGLAMRR